MHSPQRWVRLGTRPWYFEMSMNTASWTVPLCKDSLWVIQILSAINMPQSELSITCQRGSTFFSFTFDSPVIIFISKSSEPISCDLSPWPKEWVVAWLAMQINLHLIMFQSDHIVTFDLGCQRTWNRVSVLLDNPKGLWISVPMLKSHYLLSGPCSPSDIIWNESK